MKYNYINIRMFDVFLDFHQENDFVGSVVKTVFNGSIQFSNKFIFKENIALEGSGRCTGGAIGAIAPPLESPKR